MKFSTFAVLASAGTVLAQTSGRNDTSACAALAQSAPAALANLTVNIARYEAAGLLINDTAQGGAFPGIAGPYNAMCRFRGTIQTSRNSSMIFEVLMPATSVWNGDFMHVGNGGDYGWISYPDMVVPLNKYNYAVASTDTGHKGGPADGTFAINPESAIDFGYRAVHLSTVYSKAILSQFYGKNSTTNYWSGCSSGGKQGLREVTLYPDDFDAAITGSPAWYWSHLNGWTQYVNSIVNNPNGTGYIAPTAWSGIHGEVLAQCDTLDGVQDSIISSPGKCFLNFARFACGGNSTVLNSTTCLSSPQITTLRNIYGNWTDNGTLIFPGFNIGSEAQFGFTVTGFPFGAAPSYFLYQVLNQTQIVLPADSPALNINGSPVNTSQLLQLIRTADATNPALTTVDYNLQPFFDRGGKLLMYVGGADPLIPTNSTQLYYQRAIDQLGSNSSSSIALFEIPGMGHCSGGGAWNIGLPSQDVSGAGQPPVFDAAHDAQLALRAWRVNGTKPTSFIGTAYNGNNATSGTAFTRRICPWPQVGVYNGSGNKTDYTSYTCQ